MASKERSSRDTPGATASFYDAAADRYDSEVDVPTNLPLRDAIRRRVSEAAAAGSPILDFGCGTGADAAWYARRGHRTVAYDISAGMVDALGRRCAREIADGMVIPVAGGLDRLDAELARAGRLGAIAANFAVLNHVHDLRPLFRRFAPHLATGGVIVASVLNPRYWRDMRCRWWWAGALRSLGTGSIGVAGDVSTYRHFVRTVRRAAAPQFVLADRDVEVVGPERDHGVTRTWYNSFSTNFLMLVLRKRDETAAAPAPERAKSAAPADRLPGPP